MINDKIVKFGTSTCNVFRMQSILSTRIVHLFWDLLDPIAFSILCPIEVTPVCCQWIQFSSLGSLVSTWKWQIHSCNVMLQQLSIFGLLTIGVLLEAFLRSPHGFCNLLVPYSLNESTNDMNQIDSLSKHACRVSVILQRKNPFFLF